MGNWRRCDDCPRGFSSLVKLAAHQQADHPIEVLATRLHSMVKQLALMEAQERRYWGAKEALESLTPIPPGAREVLQAYVSEYGDPRWGTWSKLRSIQNRMPDLREGIDRVRRQIQRATYMRPVP